MWRQYVLFSSIFDKRGHFLKDDEVMRDKFWPQSRWISLTSRCWTRDCTYCVIIDSTYSTPTTKGWHNFAFSGYISYIF